MSMNDGGKGSTPRPFSVTQEEYSRRWDMIFGRDLSDTVEETKSDSPTEEIENTESQNSN